jgi:hypothetical protein
MGQPNSDQEQSMNEPIGNPSPGQNRGLIFAAVLFAAAMAITVVARWPRSNVTHVELMSDAAVAELNRESSHEEVVRTCGGCHPYPAPELFPKEQWPREVQRGYELLGRARLAFKAPPMSRVANYYLNRAADTLPILKRPDSASPSPVPFERLAIRERGSTVAPGIANVRLVRLTDEKRLDVVACDMIHGNVFLAKPYEPGSGYRLLTDTIPNPAHAEAVDLNKDGITDLLVANLGTPVPSEQRRGSVIWLKGRRDGSFLPITLADELGRVTDVEPADFDGDGDLDLIVAVFGRLTLGEILLLENRTANWDNPTFSRSTIDPRHGTIHVPVADLDGDGRPDFVALISQEHETVVAFLNKGDRRFEPQDIFAAPHPAFGSSGIQLVDLDKDGDLDVLLTNGDSLDSTLLRPYHGIRWLENRGSYPYIEHRVASLHGVHRAVAADLDGDGDLDIVATTFLPGPFYQPLCRQHDLDAVIILEQDAPGHFVYHPIESATCDHATCDLGDFDGDGDVDIVTANFFVPPQKEGSNDLPPSGDWVILYKNAGRRTRSPRTSPR